MLLFFFFKTRCLMNKFKKKQNSKLEQQKLNTVLQRLERSSRGDAHMPGGKNHSPGKSPLLLKLGLAGFLLPTPCIATKKTVELRACSPCPHPPPPWTTDAHRVYISSSWPGISHQDRNKPGIQPSTLYSTGEGPRLYEKGGDFVAAVLHFRLKRPRCREGHLHKGLALRTAGWASPEGRGPLFLGVELGARRPKRGRGGGDWDRRPELIGLCSPSQQCGQGPPTAVPEGILSVSRNTLCVHGCRSGGGGDK